MYKYQCSKDECRTIWALRKGSLNGFVLTCPICGKGRGLFISEYKSQVERDIHHKGEEIEISVNSSFVPSLEDMEMRIDEFIKKNSLTVVSKKIENIGKEFVCYLYYKLKE